MIEIADLVAKLSGLTVTLDGKAIWRGVQRHGEST